MLSKEEIISQSRRVKEPVISGVYFLIDQWDKIVYIGSARDLHQRLKAHRANMSLPFNKWFYIEFSDYKLMREEETNYILKFTPKFNLKDNPALIEEMELAKSLLTFEEKWHLSNTNGVLSIEKIQEVLTRNNIPSKVKRANKAY